METKSEYSSADVIANLQNNNQPFNPRFLHFFSDISHDNLQNLKTIWSNIDKSRKFNLLKDLESLMEADNLVSCDDFAVFAIQDPDPLIKSQAIQLLWETSDVKLIPSFIDFLIKDPSPEVNQAAASVLGRFVLLGELDEIPENFAEEVQDLLINEFNASQNHITRQRILESLGYSSREEVSQFIKSALKNDEKDWQLSALIAISRSADNKWGKAVLEKLKDYDSDIQIEAIKAAGELEIASAKDSIIEILISTESYEEIHLQSIWALSKIGGSDVIELLEKMIEESEDEEEIEVLEMALENLDLIDDMPAFDIFDDPE